jgi:hypothetical protein
MRLNGSDAVEERKSLAPSGNRIPAIQPIARSYTDCDRDSSVGIVTGYGLETEESGFDFR